MKKNRGNDYLLLQGSEACVRGALLAGCRFFAGYPITPATEIMELMSWELPRVGGTFIRLLHDRWIDENIDQVHVTVAESRHDQVRRAFEPVGFLTVAHEIDRYGPGRTEYVMTCLPLGQC